MPSTPSPFAIAADGVRVSLKVTPKASADRIRGVAVDQAGVAALQVSVTAAPEDGRANKAVIALLAKAWKVPKSAVELIQGAADRRKLLRVRDDDPVALAERLTAWLAGHGAGAKG